MTRRGMIAALGASALAARHASAQAAAEKDGGPKAGADSGPRLTPMVCAYSGILARVPYPELGNIAQQIGYDGVDLTVMQGGHVNPYITNVDLVRAIESVRGPGLEVPLISTNITSFAEPTAYPILAITGHTQVHMYRTGYWPWNNSLNPVARLSQVRNDLGGLLQLGQRSDMVTLFPNRAGFVGQALWDIQSVVNDLDPRWFGYYFDPSQATAEGAAGGWEIALRLALPRLKAVAVQDFYWTKTGSSWNIQMCPLGGGMVDWDSFFRILAENHFSGPLSIYYGYQASDDLAAMAKDLEFVRNRIAQAWKPATRPT